MLKTIPFSAKELLDDNFRRIDNIGYFPDLLMPVAGCLPKDIERLYGKYSFIYTTYRRLYNWAFSFNDTIFLLVSANERGTTIETTTSDPNLAEAFIRQLNDDLKTLNDEKINGTLALIEKLKIKRDE